MFFRSEVRQCRRCGKDFTSKGKKHYYCSEECRRQGSPNIKRVCKACGREFEIEQWISDHNQTKFCSLDCYRRRTPRVERICQNCGSAFTVAAGYAAKGYGQFCSQECQHNAYRSNPSRVTLICQRCGKEFVTKQSQVKWHNRRFCSFACSLLYRGETSIEELIRKELEGRDIQFDSQVQIGKFNVDFLLPNQKIVIECDGEYWHGLPESKRRDQYKDNYLFQKGYRIFRFTESEIRRSSSDCVDRVLMEA